MTHRRFQLRRSKGWRMPPNAIHCSRPTKWGNEWRIEFMKDSGLWIVTRWHRINGFHYVCNPMADGVDKFPERSQAVEFAVGKHKEFLLEDVLPVKRADVLRELGQYELLGCWCPLDQPCHVDNYLAVLNGP